MVGRRRTCRCGSFELDPRSRELRTGDVCTRLQEQPFAVLHMMMERPGDVITREEFRSRLWPDGTFVDFEHSLNAAVKRLRAALGDAADSPRFVETVPRRGYRFIAPVERDVLPFSSVTDSETGVRGNGDRVRITVRLIDAASETPLWSATCERGAGDVLTVQIEVAALQRGIAADRAAEDETSDRARQRARMTATARAIVSPSTTAAGQNERSGGAGASASGRSVPLPRSTSEAQAEAGRRQPALRPESP